MKKPEWKEYRLYGAIEGRIWMPPVQAWKEFDVWFSDQPLKPFRREWTGLENAIDYVENDGDFQNAKVTCLTLQVVHHYKTKTVHRYRELRYDPTLAFSEDEA